MKSPAGGLRNDLFSFFDVQPTLLHVHPPCLRSYSLSKVRYFLPAFVSTRFALSLFLALSTLYFSLIYFLIVFVLS